MIKLRLRRMGAKKRPSYRIVAADSRSPRDGRFIESFGFYDPITDPATIRVDAERARHWLSVGAQPTDSLRSRVPRVGAAGAWTRPTPTWRIASLGRVAVGATAPSHPAMVLLVHAGAVPGGLRPWAASGTADRQVLVSEGVRIRRPGLPGFRRAGAPGTGDRSQGLWLSERAARALADPRLLPALLRLQAQD